MGLLDLYNSGSTTLNIILTDLTTSYPSTNTGTPTTYANPGGPIIPFHQLYTDDNKYLSTLYSKLRNTLRITNLDVENPGVQGGVPYNELKDPTVYPANNVNHTSGIRGWFAAPATPPTKFNQVYNPRNTYLDFIGPV